MMLTNGVDEGVGFSLNCAATSSINLIVKEVKVFPNPTTGEIQIEHFFANDALLEVFDYQGKRVYSGRYSNGKLDMTNFLAGMYTLHITDANEKYISRIIKL